MHDQRYSYDINVTCAFVDLMILLSDSKDYSEQLLALWCIPGNEGLQKA
jgi:hypothetical protein